MFEQRQFTPRAGNPTFSQCFQGKNSRSKDQGRCQRKKREKEEQTHGSSLKEDMKKCILPLLPMQISCSQRKMTFLIYLFFASFQASFIATSSSHIVISSPEEEKNYRAQALMQVSSSHLLEMLHTAEQNPFCVLKHPVIFCTYEICCSL